MESNEIERIAKLETRVDGHDREFKSTNQRLDNLDKLTESMIEMACSVKQISSDVSEVKSDIKETKQRVNELEDRPGKWSLGSWKWFLGIIGAAILGYCLNILLS